ncbi:MAG TPA: DNA repair protein RecN [Selenomonadales bacterium]|nr:DNA repair protein RecN [Selenomonadales bacterium]
MLKTLTVSNFALIEQAGVEFAPGLNILTGETGAGKSILIDALNILLGSRASADYIRSGSDFFRVEAVFRIGPNQEARELLDSQGIPLEDGDTLILSRYLSRQGKSAVVVNGCQVTLGTLKLLGGGLVDMHGQHENQTLLKPETHLGLLDAFDPAIGRLLPAYREAFAAWTRLGEEIARLESDSRERAQRLDMLEWQTQEIAAAELEEAEEERLEQEIQVLTHAEKIQSAVSRSYRLLSEDGASGTLSSLAEVKKELEYAARFDPSLAAGLTTVADALYQLEEAASDLRDYGENLDFNPARLEKLQERMDVIHKLKKKYGATIAEVLAYYRQAAEELATISNYEERMGELIRQRDKLEAELAEIAGKLDVLRRKAATQFAGQVRGHLADLGMPKAQLIINITRQSRYTGTGNNEIAMLFSANPGEEPRPLHKVASGGELSRIALAVKTVSASRDGVGTMVFDEIDAGISGQAARMVGEKIALVGADRQVLCITHLPQIAAMADHHLRVEKRVEGKRTTTLIQTLDDEERLREVTRMVSGDNITRLALDNAAEMIASAQLRKEKWKNKAQA